jgi:hypothetical protein
MKILYCLYALYLSALILLLSNCKGSELDFKVSQGICDSLQKRILDVQSIAAMSHDDSVCFSCGLKSNYLSRSWATLLAEQITYCNRSVIRDHKIKVIVTVKSGNGASSIRFHPNMDTLLATFKQWESIRSLTDVTSKILEYWDGNTIDQMTEVLDKSYNDRNIAMSNRKSNLIDLLYNIGLFCSDKNKYYAESAEDLKTLIDLIDFMEQFDYKDDAKKLIFFYDYCSTKKWREGNIGPSL